MSYSDAQPVRELLRRIREGDRKARKQLFALLGDEREFGGLIVAMAHRLLPRGHQARQLVDTRDVVQSALRTGLRHFSDFGGETEGELCNWFRAILRTKIHRVTRRRKLDAALPRRADLDPDSDRVVAAAVNDEFVRLLHEAIQLLCANHARLFRDKP